jgi:hypothetical protein
MRRTLFLLLVIGLLCLPLPAAGAKSYYAQHYNVVVNVQDNGALEVTETVVFVFEGGPFTYVFRDLTTDFSDELTVLSAEIDGETLPQGEEAGQVEIKGNDPIEVTWHFAPTSDSKHTFTLHYVLEGVVERDGGNDLLTWQCLPNEHDYVIEASTCTINYPSAAELAAPPEIKEGEADIETAPQRVAAQAFNHEEDESYVVALRFPEGSLISRPPAWQQRRQEIRESRPTYLTTAGVVFLLGLVGVIALWQRYRRNITEPQRYVPTKQPPRTRPPAIAGVLYHEGKFDYYWYYFTATLFDLADRGFLTIEEVKEKKRWRGKDFELQRTSSLQDDALRPHERALLTSIFERDKHSVKTIRLSDVRNSITGRVNRYTKILKDEVNAQGLIDPQQKRKSNHLVYGGIITLVLSILATILFAVLFGEQFSPWSLLISGAVFLNSLIALILGTTISTLTEEGLREAHAWQDFADYLKRITRGKESGYDRNTFKQYLTYATAFGLAEKWAKHFDKKEQIVTPTWFQAVTSDAHTSAAFIGMIVAVNSTGASTGGTAATGAGASAAGGGASGAG